jgi:hypothetical protein
MSTQPCQRCERVTLCSWSDRLYGYCCGDCWTEDLTIHSTRLADAPRSGTRTAQREHDGCGPWAENAVRLLEDR